MIFGLDAFEMGAFADAADEFQLLAREYEKDAFLGHAEAGMAWHVQGDLKKSTVAWLRASTVLETYKDRPTISGRTATEGATSIILNDKSLFYDGEDYEVSLLHAFLAWDFLRLGKQDDALVEIRQGYQIQDDAETRYEATYGMNRFAHFLAAVIQETLGNLDDARIDLEHLSKKIPDHPFVKKAQARNAALLQGNTEEAGKSEIFLVFERGRVAEKVAKDFFYETKQSVGRLSLPAFGSPPSAAHALELRIDGEPVGKTIPLERVFKVAKANLKDRMGWITAKTIGRSAAKTLFVDKAAKHIEKKENGEGLSNLIRILGSIVVLATERADLRSWMTLPLSIDILRLHLPPGKYSATLHLVGAPSGRKNNPSVDLGIIQCKAGAPVWMSARSLGPRLFATVHTHNPLSSLQP